MVLPGLAQPHMEPPRPPEEPSSAPGPPECQEGAKVQRKPPAAAAPGAGTQPRNPSPSWSGDATASSRQEQGTRGHQRGQPEPRQAAPDPKAEPGAASSTSSSLEWQRPTGMLGIPGTGLGSPSCHPWGGTAEPPRGSAVPGSPQPHPHPAAFLEAMAAGKQGQQARGGDKEQEQGTPGERESERKALPSCRAGGGRGPREVSGDSPDIN